MILLRRATLLLAAFMMPNLTLAQTPVPKGAEANHSEDMKSGAVLCTWAIYRTLHAFGETCLHDRESITQRALQEAIDKIDRYIIANAPIGAERLQALKDAKLFMPTSDQLCGQDVQGMYEGIAKAGTSALERETFKLLAVPRQPTMDPCL